MLTRTSLHSKSADSSTSTNAASLVFWGLHLVLPVIPIGDAFLKKLHLLSSGEREASRMFVQFCVLAGCDFLDSVPNVGVVVRKRLGYAQLPPFGQHSTSSKRVLSGGFRRHSSMFSAFVARHTPCASNESCTSSHRRAPRLACVVRHCVYDSSGADVSTFVCG